MPDDFFFEQLLMGVVALLCLVVVAEETAPARHSTHGQLVYPRFGRRALLQRCAVPALSCELLSCQLRSVSCKLS